MCLARKAPTLGQLVRSRSDGVRSLSRLLYSQLAGFTCVQRFQRLVAAFCGFPKTLGASQSRHNFGDDACFVAHHSSADVLGVADGVGGWRNYGIDPSTFSRSLMAKCAEMVRKGQFVPQFPADLIASSYNSLRSQMPSNDHPCDAASTVMGSSTACVVVLERCGSLLHTANLGDSGFLIVRNGRIVHRSSEQQHYFNAPFQLSLMPGKRNANFIGDAPESAEIRSFSVQSGDCIVLATDGLFDNMPLPVIEREMATLNSSDAWDVQRVCNTIAYHARLLSKSATHLSPFAEKARLLGIDAIGGKPDDITVILAVVTAAENDVLGPPVPS